ncbi:hypothetical protein HDV05_005295 [Chytridiales sp. JEL 0842]|nr:hypothetical protein HDV05_005295 [Chytridiales sp. JEL 0842]
MKLSTLLSTLSVVAMAFVQALPLATNELDTSHLKVQLPYASVNGKVSEDGKIRSFLGIPYIQAPVGPLRFKPPQEIEGNLGEINATISSPECPQVAGLTNPILRGISEDCLYMDIYSPANVTADSKLPVMVWVYGGSFKSGGSATPFYDGSNIILETLEEGSNPVVVVTFNYRVGALGFLASEELRQLGALNLGLQDQRAAFLWVRKHIALFNGDPDNVTAFGESAGAFSIAAHLVADQSQPLFGKAPPSKPLFDKAILQSGAAGATSISRRQPLFDRLLNSTNCTSFTTPESKIECLRQIPSQQLLELSDNLDYGVAIDKTYIPDKPITILAKGQFQKAPLLIGANTDEGTFFQTDIQTVEQYNSIINSFTPDISANLTSLYNLSAFNNSPFLAASALYGDRVFQCPARNFADVYASSAGAPVYNYLWNKQSLYGKLQLPALGVFHFVEIPFVWNFAPGLLTPEERTLAKAIVSYWTSFAATGKPSLRDGILEGVPEWERYVPQTAEGLANGGGKRLKINEGVVGGIVEDVANDRVAECELWKEWERIRS